jgi:integrase
LAEPIIASQLWKGRQRTACIRVTISRYQGRPIVDVRVFFTTKTRHMQTTKKGVAFGRRNGKGGLSPRTVNHMHRVLSSALNHAENQAERWKLIVRNPAALLEKRDRPKIERKSVKTIGAPAAAAVLDAARERRLFIPLVPGTFCGLRRGEITALRWKSVDLDGAQLAVIASTEQTDAGAIREKGAKSGRARTIALLSLAVEELRRWRLAQAEELFRLGIRADDNWHVVTPVRRIAPAAQEPHARRFSVFEGMGHDIAWPPSQPRSPENRPGAARPFQHRDHDGHLQPPNAEYAGRRGIGG